MCHLRNNSHGTEEAPAIPVTASISISEARRRLRSEFGLVNAHYLKGFAEGMGIKLSVALPSVRMSEADFRRLEERFRRTERVNTEAVSRSRP